MKLGIGIDTGGTYTDAVIYDFESRSILGSAKSLTTKNDLTIGILGAIDKLPLDLARQAEVISLSTTLATNACVEDKGGRAKLIFFGGDPAVIDKFGGPFGLPASEDMLIQESFTSFSGGVDREPDWDLFEKNISQGFEDLDGVGILEINAMRNGAVVEKKAKELFQKKHQIPVVCGHELFSELNCLQRGSSTLLNAGLFPVISDFLDAVKKALAARDIRPASLVMVRSDGSLMSEKFAALRPVETMLSGPAASAIGCSRLADDRDSIVVDMGGTTTDIAYIKGGAPVTVTDGVSVGKWKTYVNGLYVKTFGLGGDTAVHYEGKNLYLEEYRIIPLCVAAKNYPNVVENLKKLEKRRHTRFLYEHYALIRDISESTRYTQEEKDFCQILKNGPLSIGQAAEAVGKDVYTLRVDRLLRDGVVQLCGLTPTDIMHIKGDFRSYNAEASRLAAEFAAVNLGVSLEELCDQVYDAVKCRLYVNIVKSMLENKDPDYMKNGVGPELEKFILETYREVSTGFRDPLFSASFKSTFSLVGVGAPIQVFLEDVAQMLGTHAVIPENHQVANALGAIVGSVNAVSSVEIGTGMDDDGFSGYLVYGSGGKMFFKELEDAVAYASDIAAHQAEEAARQRGIQGQITVTTTVSTTEAPIRDGSVYLGSVVTAHATGTMGF